MCRWPACVPRREAGSESEKAGRADCRQDLSTEKEALQRREEAATLESDRLQAPPPPLPPCRPTRICRLGSPVASPRALRAHAQ